jgi:predicted enzyme related to lactoylglutathione lyase
VTAHGKVVYLEIPSDDVERSAAFYDAVFGWRTRRRGDGALAFDDATGGVSGAWVTGRPASDTAGALVYVNVTDIEASAEVVSGAGGTVVQPLGGDPGELTVRFLDPYGNLFGLYQEPVG